MGDRYTIDQWNKLGKPVVENEKHPKKENSEIDIKQVMLWKIDNGWIDNEEDSIRSELRRLCPYRKKQSIDRVSHSIMTESGAPLKYQFFFTVSHR